MLVRMLITGGATADCSQTVELIEGIDADYLLANRTYEANEIVKHCEANEIEPVIPSKKNHTRLREHDRKLYHHRHLVENACSHLKRWGGIAIRYAKNAASFVAATHIRCICN